MAEPSCHYCDQPAEAECPTCGRLYCPEHGEEVCLRCLAPESATPSALAYRGSILALIVATLVAAFLVISPPESKSRADSGRTVATATPAVLATATATRPGGSPTPARTPSTATGSPSPAASASPVTTASATPGGERSHTVAAGDTLSAIATKFGTTVDEIKSLNGLTSDTLQIGAVLRIPPAQ
jgi:LysM repeat protein